MVSDSSETKVPNAAKILNALGVTIHEMLRYGYGGLLSLLLAAWHEPEHTERAVKAWGVFITTIAALAVGAALYTAHIWARRRCRR